MAIKVFELPMLPDSRLINLPSFNAICMALHAVPSANAAPWVLCSFTVAISPIGISCDVPGIVIRTRSCLTTTLYTPPRVVATNAIIDNIIAAAAAIMPVIDLSPLYVHTATTMATMQHTNPNSRRLRRLSSEYSYSGFVWLPFSCAILSSSHSYGEKTAAIAIRSVSDSGASRGRPASWKPQRKAWLLRFAPQTTAPRRALPKD